MEIRCPQCHSPVDLDDDTSISDITCPSCGGRFCLLGEETELPHIAQQSTIGHFELIDQLGAGSYGAVWRARDTKLDRIVAVKIPRKGQIDLADVCGIAPVRRAGEFVVTSGFGVIARLRMTESGPQIFERATTRYRWDNHLTLMAGD